MSAISLRDHFAGLAMQGLLSSTSERYDEVYAATQAYAMADAMLAERAKGAEVEAPSDGALYVIVDRHGWVSDTYSLKKAIEKARVYDDTSCEDAPHNVCPIGAPVPR